MIVVHSTDCMLMPQKKKLLNCTRIIVLVLCSLALPSCTQTLEKEVIIPSSSLAHSDAINDIISDSPEPTTTSHNFESTELASTGRGLDYYSEDISSRRATRHTEFSIAGSHESASDRIDQPIDREGIDRNCENKRYSIYNRSGRNLTQLLYQTANSENWINALSPGVLNWSKGSIPVSGHGAVTFHAELTPGIHLDAYTENLCTRSRINIDANPSMSMSIE